MPFYVQKRRRRWYACLEIPSALRSHFDGRPRFLQSLKTESESEAHRRALPLIALWKRRLADARGATPEVSEATFWRETLAKATGDERDTLSLVVSDRAEAIERERGEKAAKLFADVAFDQVKLLAPLADQWLAEANYPPRGTYQHRRTLALLYTRHTTVSEIDRRTAGAFVTEVLAQGRKPETVNRSLSTYLLLWSWMEKRGYVEVNPWRGQSVKKKRSNGKHAPADDDSRRRPFTEDEGRAFLAALDNVDRDVSMVAAVTGMRLEEVASLAPADMETKANVVWLSITKGKTAAAVRRVPVVAPSVRKMLLARKAKGKDRLFHELQPDRFGDLGSALGKRVGRKLRAIGLTDPALVAEHSWRHRARTLMEHADIMPWVADAVLGHARPGEGLGRYSVGPSEEQRIEAVKAITLPA
jgi:integrase